MPYREIESSLLLDEVIIPSVPVSDGCICYPVAIATDVKQFNLRQRQSLLPVPNSRIHNYMSKPKKLLSLHILPWLVLY